MRSVVVLCLVVSTLVTHSLANPPVVYSTTPALFPLPVSVALNSSLRVGPSVANLSALTTTIDPACSSSAINATALVAGAWTSRTVMSDPVHFYPAASYQPALDAACPTSRQCSTSSDCASASQTCYTPPEQRWNSSLGCSPSPNSGKCGCCVDASSGPPALTHLVVTCSSSSLLARASGQNVTLPDVSSTSEAYTLSVDASTITITAAGPVGVARAATTLGQLLRYDFVSGVHFIDQASIDIVDYPRFPYRGVMLDTSRHFIPVSTIHSSVIPGVAAGKFNVFHWHIVDSPSFPLQSEAFPELSKEGAFDSQSTYSPDDVKSVVSIAASYGIDVVLELDTPAHTMAMGRSHPELMTNCWDWQTFTDPKTTDRDDTAAINPVPPGNQAFVKKLVQEAAALTPGRYFHVGGDEVKTGCWNSSDEVRDYVSKTFGGVEDVDFRMLQAQWTAKVTVPAVGQVGKTAILWQPTTGGPSDPAWPPSLLPPGTVYMAWLDQPAVAAYAKANLSVVTTIGLYVAGLGSWEQAYNAPMMPANLTKDQEANVLGASVCAWGETMSGANVLERLFTVGGGAAEPMWSPSVVGGGEVGGDGDVGVSMSHLSVQDRFNRWLCHLVGLGVVSSPVNPSHCHVPAAL